MKSVYPALSKKLFYFRMHISNYVLKKNCVPLNPFMIFEYFLLDTVDRDIIYKANHALVTKADELWVFGQISDGVLAEIKLAEKLKKPIRYFEIIGSKKIKEISKTKAEFEKE